MADMDDVVLHVQTPLIYSAPLSELTGRDVYCKLENTQPSGSFKLRGIGHVCRLAVKGGNTTHLICSSGGNAGLATAYCAKQLGVKATVFTMDGLPQSVLKKFHDLGCDIYIGGSVWDTCDATARKFVEKLRHEGERPFYVHPFDSQAVWDGHSTMMHEVHGQLRGVSPSAVITCVGGGGLLAGIDKGLQSIDKDHVPILAMETHGADSYNKAIAAGKPIKLEKITSVAKTLGALQVCDRVVEITKRRKVISKVTSDAKAVEACWRFLRDHQFLVEPACGATLSAIYENKLEEYLGENLMEGPVVVVICGGATMDLNTLLQLKQQFDISEQLDRTYDIEQYHL